MGIFNMTTSSFGGIVKTERKIRGWTQQFLAIFTAYLLTAFIR